MTRKEWREVGRQSLYFVLAMAAMALLAGLAGLLQGKPVGGEQIVIMLGLWMLVFSMFLGLSPFAMDSKQKGMEYLLTLPVPRRRLLFIKLLPRLAAIVLFYLLYVVLYRLIGSDVFGGGFVLFSLTYFALFLISYSLSVVHENFIIQFIWAGIILCGYLALCLSIVMLGFFWKFRVPLAWVGPRIWHNLSYDIPTLLSAIAVFLLMAAPFIFSYFLAFKRFDLKPARAFNRRHLLIFLPLLLLASAASLGLTYFVQSSSHYGEQDLFVLKNQRLLRGDFPGKLTLFDKAGRRQVDTNSAVFWDRLLLEQGERLYLSGYDTKSGERIIGVLDQANLSWKVLHRVPEGYFVANEYMGLQYDGQGFVYLKGYPVNSRRLGTGSSPLVKPGVLELVRVDPAGGESRTIGFRSPLFRKYYEPWLIGSDVRNGLRFWLISHPRHNVLRLWEDGRVEELGVSKGLPAYAAGLLFCRGDHSLQVRRLLAAGSEVAREIEGTFNLANSFHFSQANDRMGEIYAERDRRIVRIDLATLDVEDVGPDRGHIWMVPPGDFYYVEFETWPARNSDKWKKLYRLQGGKMLFLKRFDFHDDDGYGHIFVDTYGVILRQEKIKNSLVSRTRARAFAFPGMRELRFKGLD